MTDSLPDGHSAPHVSAGALGTSGLARARATPLDHPEHLPLRPASAVTAFGRTCVIAPHQDDDALGCGGAIALLRQAGLPVFVLFVSDGTGSHPVSASYPPERLRDLREHEARAALACLDVPEGMYAFLRLRDTAVPGEGDNGFLDAVDCCRSFLTAFAPETVLLPWRRDFHRDHRASCEITRAATAGWPTPLHFVEYPIWVYEHLEEQYAPRPGEMDIWRLDIADVVATKQAAIHCHRSQITDLIADDPACFRLLPEVLERFAYPWEIYLEESHG